MRHYNIVITDEQAEQIDRLVEASGMTYTAYILSLMGMKPANRPGRRKGQKNAKNEAPVKHVGGEV